MRALRVITRRTAFHYNSIKVENKMLVCLIHLKHYLEQFGILWTMFLFVSLSFFSASRWVDFCIGASRIILDRANMRPSWRPHYG